MFTGIVSSACCKVKTPLPKKRRKGYYVVLNTVNVFSEVNVYMKFCQ